MILLSSKCSSSRLEGNPIGESMRKIKQLIYQFVWFFVVVFLLNIYYIHNIPFICVELGEDSWEDCLNQRYWVQACYFKKKKVLIALFKIETFQKEKKSAYANIKIFKLVCCLLCAIT